MVHPTTHTITRCADRGAGIRAGAMNTRRLSPVILTLAACVQNVGPGPDLGRCADYPDGAYAPGQVGIGSCLAGPTDLRFVVDEEGETWLLVTNANPSRIYTSGSLLAIRFSDVLAAGPRARLDELDTRVLPMESFVARIGLHDDLALVTGRVSNDSFTVTQPDRTWLIDLDLPTGMTYAADRPFIGVRQDPFDVQIDGDIAFVLSPTASSISVIDLAASPPDLLDPAPPTRITDLAFTDAGAISHADLRVTVDRQQEVPLTDGWTAAWRPGTTRLWVPGDDGLSRWSTGGEPPVPSGFGVELGTPSDTEALTDPWINQASDALVGYAAVGDRIRAAYTDGSAGGWAWSSTAALIGGDGWTTRLGGPAVTNVGDRLLLYFDGRSAAGADDAAIGVATTVDNVTFTPRAEPILSAPAGFVGLAQPTVFDDPLTLTARMWMSMWDGSQWSIGLSESAEGLRDWSDAEEVLRLPGADVGAPYVVWWGGLYRMWLSVDDGTGWTFATAWSWDGRVWSEPELLLSTPAISDDGRPPRLGVQEAPTALWEVRGDSYGPIDEPLPESTAYNVVDLNLNLRAASGHLIGVGPTDLGVEPRSTAQLSGLDTVYATRTNADGRDRLVALQPRAGGWITVADDLIPANTGGNTLGARAPVVWGADGDWHMLYAVATTAGASLRAATSTDGLVWLPTAGSPIDDLPSWASVSLAPGSVEILDGGDVRVWVSGHDGGRPRIGAIRSDDGVTFTAERGPAGEVWLDLGAPGTFDDAGLADPVLTTCGGTRTLWYSAFDGAGWTLGVATQSDDGVFSRRRDPRTTLVVPALSTVAASFAASGLRSPAPGLDACSLLLAGSDGAAWRTGEALIDGDRLFPAWRAPNPGDSFRFVTRRGEPGTSVISLGQVIDGVSLPGSGGQLGSGSTGMSTAIHDEANGRLYVLSRAFPGIVVVDIRDDSAGTFTDLNYLDIEAVLRVQAGRTSLGYVDGALVGDLLYLSARDPDGVHAIDISGLIDDATKEVIDVTPAAVLPMPDQTDDAGARTTARLGAGSLAYTTSPLQDLLLVPHFRDNSVTVFEVHPGEAEATPLRYLRDVGENPHMVRISPDGRYAVVANQQGDVDENLAASTLTLIDLDPTSPTWLEVVGQVANR